MKKRYKVIKGSASAHCCFDYTVGDTKNDGPVCECFDLASAELIADALNKSDRGNEGEKNE